MAMPPGSTSEPSDSTLTSDMFIEMIRDELNKGYGFVPFIGAGFSAPSGSPLVWDLIPYLQRCIWLALGHGSLQHRPWNPRTDQWPAFNDQANGDFYWSEVDLAQQSLSNRDSRKQILKEALGAMAEWRASLTFLSRITATPPDNPNEGWVISLDAPNHQVKEGCIRHVLADKFPTLGHRMLARLAPSLRLNSVLTTNFDDLLEIAFLDAKNKLEKVPVLGEEALPSYSSLSQLRSLVKMHGDTYSLRLDHSLDALPSEQDRSTFLDYLSCPSSIHKTDHRERLSNKEQKARNHLLVLGVSAADKRTTDFVMSAFAGLDNNFHVFWICHSPRDVQNLQAFRAKIQNTIGSHRNITSRLVCIQHSHLGLLFLQLFQSLRNTLPTAGVVFPSVSRLALPPSPATNIEDEEFTSKITNAILSCQRNETRLRCLLLTSQSNSSGVISLASRSFSEIEGKSDVCLWFDMDDISSTEDLFEQLLDASCYRIGLEHWLPAHVSRDPSAQARALHDVLLKSNKKWIVFLNLREPPGSNVDEEITESYANGWADTKRRSSPGNEDRTDNAYSLFEFIRELTLPERPNESRGNITVVLLLRRAENGPALLEQLMTQTKPTVRVLEMTTKQNQVNTYSDRIVFHSLQWLLTNSTKLHLDFLLTLLFSQRIRYASLIWSKKQWRPHASNWLQDLEKLNLIRRKSGGFLWIHSRVRKKMRDFITKKENRESLHLSSDAEEQKRIGTELTRIGNILDSHDIQGSLAEIHWHLAKWYKKVLGSTSAPGAVFEAIYHACESAESLVIDDTRINPGVAVMITERIDWASALLSSQSFLIQSQGYSRNSCRRLRHLRDNHFKRILLHLESNAHAEEIQSEIKRSISRLQIRCYEIMRAIAREVGEDFRAYARHEHVRNQYSIQRNFKITKLPTKIRPNNPRTIVAARWWRWSGMLGIASRSYDGAQSALVYALRWIAFAAEINWQLTQMEDLATIVANECSNRSGLGQECMQRHRVEAARIVEVYVQKLLLRLNLSYRLNNPTKMDLDQISMLIDSGIRISESLYADYHSDSHFHSRAAWLESRFLMHRAILCSYAQDGGGYTPAGVLTDAESTLQGIYAQKGSSYAVVELHRTEIYLRQAVTEEVTIYVRKPLFSKIRRNISIGRISEIWLEEYDENTGHFLQQPHLFFSSPTRTLSHITDASTYIKRAESILTIRRRSVWWTTWYIQRRLTIISLSIWESVLESRDSIPFFGYEHALPDHQTLPEQLLNDAISIIRVDAYRLATIVKEFANCCIAYIANLYNLDRDRPEWAKTRCLNLQTSLDKGIHSLEIVWEKRKTPVSHQNRPTNHSTSRQNNYENIDDAVEEYIYHALEHANKVSELLEKPRR